jgi:two-component system KDP operon response regulator KdpE
MQEESRQSTRVLLVDDSAEDLAMYAEYLAGRGYDVTIATDGEQAVDLALREHFDVAVVDIGMPRLDGFGVARVLRNYTRTKRLPIISLSARTGEQVRSEAMDAGANLALEKPYPPDQLEATLQAFLRGLSSG